MDRAIASPRLFGAVVFDLFDTLVRWSPERLPQIRQGDRLVPSTFPYLMPLLEKAFGECFDRDGYLAAYAEVLGEIESARAATGCEVTCRERFVRVLRRVGRSSPEDAEALAEALTRAHMRAVREVTAAPLSWTRAVRKVAESTAVALLSNFDDSETGHQIVSDTGLAPLFAAVVISADVGLRKPRPEVFRRVLDALGLEPHRVLHVGDSPREDVAGAKAVGMAAAWVARPGRTYPPDLVPPDFVVGDVTEIPGILGLDGCDRLGSR